MADSLTELREMSFLLLSTISTDLVLIMPPQSYTRTVLDAKLNSFRSTQLDDRRSRPHQNGKVGMHC